MPTLIDRIEAIERKIAQQQQILDKITELQDISDFIPVSEAATVLRLTGVWLRTKIREAKAFPGESPYKEGIHWKQVQRGDSFRYLINIREWGKL